jgi:hypothetical protein
MTFDYLLPIADEETKKVLKLAGVSSRIPPIQYTKWNAHIKGVTFVVRKKNLVRDIPIRQNIGQWPLALAAGVR